jgi:glutamate-1-semialdehyde 2,1-aminomutase
VTPAGDSQPPVDRGALSLAGLERPVLPGGYGRSSLVVGVRSPYADRADGYVVWDDSGRKLIDLNNNFTALIHGHANPMIVGAASKALTAGSAFGLPTAHEAQHARDLLERLPGADQVRYANSGTEAVMLALRIARARTGRSRCALVRGAYHGTADAVLAAGGRRSRRGVPDSALADTTLLALNDERGLESTVGREPEAYAAVLIDLLPNRAGLVPASEGFVATTRELCERHEILLIVDEVVSLRLVWEGLASAYGLQPDLTVLGKMIGGGFPVGAVAGPAEVMAELDPLQERGLEHGGTFTANPVTMAAGVAALRLYDVATLERLNALGEAARLELTARVEPLGWEIRGRGSMLRPFPVGRDDRQADLQLQLWWAAYERGLLLTPNALATLSTPMDEAVVDQMVSELAGAVADVARSG